MKNRLLPIVLLPLLVFLGAASSTATESTPVNPAGYRVTQGPSTVRFRALYALYWVDNERLLFMASGYGNARAESSGVFLWHVHTETVQRYQSEPIASSLCVADGRVSYTRKRGDEFVVFDGPFGQEKERPRIQPRDPAEAKSPPSINFFTCKEYLFSDVLRPRGGRPYQLRAEHGFLEFVGTPLRTSAGYEVAMPPFRVWVHHEGRSTEVPFPYELTTKEFISPPLAYSALVEGYLLRREERILIGGAGGVNRFFLWLPSSNVVRMLDIPASADWWGLEHPVVTREGLVLNNSKPNHAGIYLFRGTEVEKFLGRSLPGAPATRSIDAQQIVSGARHAMSDVSPDGCRIATVVDLQDKNGEVRGLELVDFCKNENQRAQLPAASMTSKPAAVAEAAIATTYAATAKQEDDRLRLTCEGSAVVDTSCAIRVGSGNPMPVRFTTQPTRYADLLRTGMEKIIANERHPFRPSTEDIRILRGLALDKCHPAAESRDLSGDLLQLCVPSGSSSNMVLFMRGLCDRCEFEPLVLRKQVAQ